MRAFTLVSKEHKCLWVLIASVFFITQWNIRNHHQPMKLVMFYNFTYYISESELQGS